MIKFIQAMLAILCALVIWTTLPKIEGGLFPVIENINIKSVRPHNELLGTSIVTGTFDKVRECDYIGLTWHFGRVTGDNIRVSARILSEPVVRKVGNSYDFEIQVVLSPIHIAENSFAEITYNCYNGWLWNNIARHDISRLVTVDHIRVDSPL